MKINCIVVEDEPLALERTAEYVHKIPFLDLRATFDNALDALAFLKANRVELIFLDINLGDVSGIQLLETSAVKSRVILTTAYQEYALKGFDLKVTDYLLKPFTFERFVQAVDRAAESLPKKQSAPPVFFFVKTENRLEKIFLREIIFIEGMGDYRRIHTTGGKRLMTPQTFAEFERQIPAHVVCRVHKSFMVALERIDSIDRRGIRIKERTIPISETYRERFYKLINQPGK